MIVLSIAQNALRGDERTGRTFPPRRAYAYTGTWRDSTRLRARVSPGCDVRELLHAGGRVDRMRRAAHREPSDPSDDDDEASLSALPVLLEGDLEHRRDRTI